MKSVILIFWLCALAMPARAQSTDQHGDMQRRIKTALVTRGFENVTVVLAESKLIVRYENRIYRHAARGVQEALRMVLPFARGVTHLVLIPQYRQLPLLAITVPLATTLALSHGTVAYDNSAATGRTVEVALAVPSDWRRLQTLPRANTSLRKFDLVVHPQVHTFFGDYDDPWKFQLNLVPEMAVSLWPGMSLSAQLIIPLHNEFGPEGGDIRPGVMACNQLLRLPRNTFAAVTLGYFTRQRYGVDLEIKKYFMNGKFSLGGNAGCTGYASYDHGKWTYSPLHLWTALANADYRWSRSDLFLRATYGRFLYQDQGWRWEVLRQFGELDIGFYGLRTQTGTNLGFNFSIPIFPPTYSKPGMLRVRTAQYFHWEYRYWGIWESGSSGFRYDTGQRMDDFMKGFNPDHIEKEVSYQPN